MIVTRWMSGRAAAGLLALGLALLAAAPAAAQIPGMRGGRPQGVPQGRAPQGLPQQGRPGQAGRDTVPGDSARPVVQDSVIDQLLRLPGYQPVEYQGDSAQFDNRQRTLRLRGNPVVTRGGSRIQARDSIVYRERSEFVEVYGDPQVTGEGQDIAGEVIYYDLANRRASVRNARTTVTEGATWYVQGNVTTEGQGERVYATGGTFTSDDRPEPAYHFRAGRLKVIKNRVLVGRPALLYFRNVPVFILPFIVQDLGRGRRSGFLIPEFEINDIVRTDQRGRGTRGTGRQIRNVGYYWAINEYMGAQASLDWRSQSWIALDVGYQFNWKRRFLSGNGSFRHFWREEAGREFAVSGSGSWRPNERTDLATSLNFTSNPRFERNRVVDPFRQTSSASSTLSFTRRTDWGTITSGGELRQEISSGDNDLRTRFSVSPEPITLLPTREGADPRWYNDAALTLSADASADRSTPGDGLQRRRQEEQNAEAALGGSFRVGPITISGNTRYNRRQTLSLAALDSAAADSGVDRSRLGMLPGFGVETLDWSASTGYEFRLIGATRFTPSISIGQQAVRRDTGFVAPPPDSLDQRRYGEFVGAPPRLTFGAGLKTDLYGFFPGFGPYERIRHRLSPSLTYSYQPSVRQDTIQRLVYGFQGGIENNGISFGVDQTWEAKLRAPAGRPDRDQGAEERAGTGNPQGADQGNARAQTDTARAELLPDQVALRDTAAADTAGGGAAGGPDQSRKVTLLAFGLTGLAYSFVPVDQAGLRGFTTRQIQTNVRSDLLGGLNFTVGFDLFRDTRTGESGGGLLQGGDREFSPYLTGVQTSLSFGANSALFRWLGFGRATEGQRRTERGQTPAEEGVPTTDPPGAQTMTNRPMGTGGGAWNVSLNYSLVRMRPAPLGLGVPQTQGLTNNNQQVSGNVTFLPTRNWAVNWYTDYSITRNEFGTHVLNFKRDLYRWQANFDFIRAPNGNTSFSFSVHLQDLPDLKADYSRQNLGADRAGTR